MVMLIRPLETLMKKRRTAAAITTTEREPALIIPEENYDHS